MMVAALLLICCSQTNAQLLKGICKGFMPEDSTLTITYSPTGGVLDQNFINTKVHKDGSFSWNGPVTERNHDIGVTVNDKSYGAHLIYGKTVRMTFGKDESMTTVSIDGPEKEVSLVVNEMEDAYDPMQYFSVDPDLKKTNKEYRDILDAKYKKVTTLIKNIKDKKLRQFYTDLNEGKYTWVKLRIIMNGAEEKKLSPKDDPEYKTIMSRIDPNSDIAYRTNLGYAYVTGKNHIKLGFKTDMGPYCRSIMALTDKYVTNPLLRQDLIRSVGQFYFRYGDNSGNYHQFYKDICQWAGKDSVTYAEYKDIITSWDKTKAGTKAFDITLTDRDGKTCLLSELTKGKFTYIDVWATWCGPCKAEIPYLAKLVEKEKGNKNMQVISISIDKDVEAWKKMINADKPAWPQYNVNGDTEKLFIQQWGISGIPRFIMIDNNGNIFNADAPRPSDEKTAKIIEEQTK